MPDDPAVKLVVVVAKNPPLAQFPNLSSKRCSIDFERFAHSLLTLRSECVGDPWQHRRRYKRANIDVDGEEDDMNSRIIWLALIALSGVLAGACVCALFWVLSVGAAAALTAGGAAFLGVATLGVAVMAVLPGD
jgi:hypothetical protein